MTVSDCLSILGGYPLQIQVVDGTTRQIIIGKRGHVSLKSYRWHCFHLWVGNFAASIPLWGYL